MTQETCEAFTIHWYKVVMCMWHLLMGRKQEASRLAVCG